jgi:hypothetical protein
MLLIFLTVSLLFLLFPTFLTFSYFSLLSNNNIPYTNRLSGPCASSAFGMTYSASAGLCWSLFNFIDQDVGETVDGGGLNELSHDPHGGHRGHLQQSAA